MPFSLDSWPVKIGIIAFLVALRTIIWFSSRPDKSSRVERDNSGAQGWLETIDSAAVAIGLVFFIIQPFLVQAFYIPSGSMQDTLRDVPVGDRLLVSKLVYRLRDPRTGEIVVFRAPEAATQNTTVPPGSEYIKRCMGRPGDVVYAQRGKYFRNGKLLNEPYTKWSSQPPGYYDLKIVDGKLYHREYSSAGESSDWLIEGPSPMELWQQAPDQKAIEQAKPGPVPEGKYLMLGDHRDRSSDSHIWGFVPRENIVGKAIFIFWPLNRISLIDRIKPTPQRLAQPAF
jgi:signal peptidase I